MNIKNISIFLIMVFLFCPETKTMPTAAQRAAIRTGTVKRSRTPYQVTAPIRQIPLTTFESIHKPMRSFSFLPEVPKKPKMTWTDWFSSLSLFKTPQKQYFSSPNVPATNTLLLLKAIQSGSKEKIYELIKKGLIDINARYDDNETILHIAAKSGASPDIISLLINAGADVHAKSRYGYTPLHDAALYQNVEAVKLLVAKGANPNTLNTKDTEAKIGFFLTPLPGRSPLYLAQKDDRPSKKTLEIIKFLEPLTDKSLWFVVTPEIALRRAILSNSLETVKQLMTEHEFSKSALNTALLDAASSYKIQSEILALLIDAGADVTTQDSLKKTPLHYAAYYGNLAAVKLLLNNGAHPNILDSKGRSSLDLAKEDYNPSKETLEIIRILESFITDKPTKQAGTSMSLEDEQLLLRRTINSNNAASVKQVLTEYTFSKDALNDALIEAARGSFAARAEILALLIDAGAEVNTQDSLKRTPLHHASYFDNPAAVKLLLSKGAHPNVLDYKGRSPLYFAQEEDIPSQETLEVIRLLEPVTNKSLWFVVTPEVMLRRAVKSDDPKKVRSALEIEEELSTSEKKEAGQSTQQTQKRAKKFTAGSQEELLKAWQQVSDKKPVYEILGLDKESSEKEIDRAYMHWVRNHHPDLYRDETLNKKAHTVLLYLNEHLR